MRERLPRSRRDQIVGRLDAGLPVVAAELAIEFSVSEDAIRRDLRALAAKGRCERVYGGALPLSPASTPFAARLDEAPLRKQLLARAAIATIEPGEVIFLDTGSTNQALAHELPSGLNLTVVTNAVRVASTLYDRPGITLIMIGGAVDAAVGGCVGGEAVIELQRLNIDRCFLGACAISAAGGVAAFDAADAVFKRTLLSVSRKTVVMATNEKLETRALHVIAPVAALERVIVEHDAPSEIVALLEVAGSSVDIAAKSAAEDHL